MRSEKTQSVRNSVKQAYMSPVRFYMQTKLDGMTKFIIQKKTSGVCPTFHILVISSADHGSLNE